MSFKGVNESSEILPRPITEYLVARTGKEQVRVLQYARWQPFMVMPYADNELNEALNKAILYSKPLGQGGVHVAYPFKRQVIKMDALWLRHWIRNYAPALVPQLVSKNMCRYIDKERQHIQEFEKAFDGGRIIVPRQQIFMGTVELGDERLLQLGADSSKLANFLSMPTFYRLTPYIPELNPPSADFREIRTGYAEKKRPPGAPLFSRAEWERANEVWVTLTRKEDFDGALLERIQPAGSLGKLLNECRHNREVRLAVEEFVRKAIKYSETTGKIVDIIGAQNAFLNSNDDIVLHDALYSENEPILNGAAKLFCQIAEGKQPDTMLEWYAMNDLANALNYVRGINALAHGLGMPERLRTFHLSKPIQWDSVFKAIQNHWSYFRGMRLYPISGERKYWPSGT